MPRIVLMARRLFAIFPEELPHCGARRPFASQRSRGCSQSFQKNYVIVLTTTAPAPSPCSSPCCRPGACSQ
eukprot:15270710-Heterocapsa_arctica.AAC.1